MAISCSYVVFFWIIVFVNPAFGTILSENHLSVAIPLRFVAVASYSLTLCRFQVAIILFFNSNYVF